MFKSARIHNIDGCQGPTIYASNGSPQYWAIGRRARKLFGKDSYRRIEAFQVEDVWDDDPLKDLERIGEVRMHLEGLRHVVETRYNLSMASHPHVSAPHLLLRATEGSLDIADVRNPHNVTATKINDTRIRRHEWVYLVPHDIGYHVDLGGTARLIFTVR